MHEEKVEYVAHRASKRIARSEGGIERMRVERNQIIQCRLTECQDSILQMEHQS